MTWRSVKRPIAWLNCVRQMSLTCRVRGKIRLDEDLIKRCLISAVHLGVITVKIKCARWTRGFIAIVRWRSNGKNQVMPSLHAQRGEIKTFHLRSDGRGLMASIHQKAFNLSHWLKMNQHIWQLCPILPINWNVLRDGKPFLDFWAIRTV